MSQFIPAYIIAYSNADFTNPHEVVLPDEPKDCTADYTHMGVKYWGFETSRHLACRLAVDNKSIRYNHNDHHWLKIAFRKRAVISGLRVSTRWFTGNQVRAVSVVLIDELSGQKREVLSREKLRPDDEHCFCFDPATATEALIRLYYEGGIARINFFGEASSRPLPQKENLLEKAVISHVSNDHYGHPAMAVKGQRKEMHMVGWESARTGFGESAVFSLAHPAKLSEIVVDTYLHRLNAPLTCHLFGLPVGSELEREWQSAPRWKLRFEDGLEVVPAHFQDYMLAEAYLNEPAADPFEFEILLHLPDDSSWQPVLPFEALRPDTFHRFFPKTDTFFSHLLYLHYPNGGIHALKVFGIEKI